MEKKKFFLIFIIAGAVVIFFQQCSLQHWVKPNLNQLQGNGDNIDNSWFYNKFHRYKQLKSNGDKSNSKFARSDSLFEGFNPLRHFVVYPPNNVSRVLLFAYFRSGSSFVGDLLQQNWKSFYSFEPLHFMTRYTRIDDRNLTQAVDLINAIFKCVLTPHVYYVKWIQKNQFLLKWNKFLWSVCRFRPKMCYDVDYVSQACQRSKYNIIKVVRLQMKHVEVLWRQLAVLNLKVVYLVRDPRGIYNSRKNMEWCNKEEICANLANICTEMRQDLNDFDHLKLIMGNNLLLVRYEDLSLNPSQSSKKLFAQLQLDYSFSVARFVKTHTKSHRRNEQLQNPYSTYRANSSSTAFQWMHDLNHTEIDFAQRNCSDILARLNYTIIDTVIDDDRELVIDSTDDSLLKQ